LAIVDSQEVDDLSEADIRVEDPCQDSPHVVPIQRQLHTEIARLESPARKMTGMDMPLVVVVTGPPAAGKTTIARGIAERLRLPLIAKDTIKEALFDGLGASDVEWSQRLGAATYLVLDALVGESVRMGASLVLEANFARGEAEAQLAALPARFVQVHCSAPLDLLLERYGERRRHPGHVDAERIEALRDAVESGRHDPLELPGETIRLDTSAEVNLDAVVRRIRRASSSTAATPSPSS
jgi:predicted kinase